MSVGSLNLGYTLFNKAALKSFASSILQEKSNLKILIFWCTVKAEVKGGGDWITGARILPFLLVRRDYYILHSLIFITRPFWLSEINATDTYSDPGTFTSGYFTYW